MMSGLQQYAANNENFDPEVDVIVENLAARFAQAAIAHVINPGGGPD
jgi:hypothetical protein